MQVANTGRVTHLAQRFRLDLADTFARHAEVLANLFERVFLPILEAKAHFEHFAFTNFGSFASGFPSRPVNGTSSGSNTGSSSSCTSTIPHLLQYKTGIGVPQYR